MPFTSKLKCDFVPLSDNIILTAELAYRCDRSQQVFVVPQGFVSDGASIPRVLWPIIGQPFDFRWRKEAVLHDFFYRAEHKIVSRKLADQIFYDSLRDNGLRYTKAQSMYIGLRLFGWAAWSSSLKETTL